MQRRAADILRIQWDPAPPARHVLPVPLPLDQFGDPILDFQVRLCDEIVRRLPRAGLYIENGQLRM